MTEPSTEPTSAPHRKLTPAEWEQVVVLWEAGTVTLQDLSDRFGISKPALHEGLKKRASIKGSRSKEFAKHTEESLKSEASRRAESIKEFRGSYHKYGDFIMKATMKELSDLMSEAPRTLETKRRIFTCLKYSAEIFAVCNREKHILFELDKDRNEDGDLPDIGVVQYTTEEIDKIKTRFDVPDSLFESDEVLAEALAIVEGMESGE